MDENEFKDELKKLLDETFTKMSWEQKTQVFGGRFGTMVLAIVNNSGIETNESAQYSMGLMLVSLMQTCFRHPEWMAAVCGETEALLGSDTAEAGMLDMLDMWPIGRREVVDAD